MWRKLVVANALLVASLCAEALLAQGARSARPEPGDVHSSAFKTAA
jgi:hypothetical protein